MGNNIKHDEKQVVPKDIEKIINYNVIIFVEIL